MSEDLNASRLTRVAELLTSYVVPIYIDVRGTPVQFGSAFFVAADGRHFLVTAAHVLDHGDDGLPHYYDGPSSRVPIYGTVCRSPASNGRARDAVDVGVVMLPKGVFPPGNAVGKACIDMHEMRPALLPRQDKTYIVIGFPATRNQAKHGSLQLTATAYAYHGGSPPRAAYEAHGRAEEDHLLIDFNRKLGRDSGGSIVHFPKPQGMSGGPVWLFSTSESFDFKFGFPLVAVATEHLERDKLIQCTDIAVALRMIGELLALVPTS